MIKNMYSKYRNSKYLFYRLKDYSQCLLKPIKPVHRSIITDDDIALDIIQNENWQYFIETILKTCQTNNGGINNTVELKNIKLIKNSVENITICKQTYQNFYDQISQYFQNFFIAHNVCRGIFQSSTQTISGLAGTVFKYFSSGLSFNLFLCFKRSQG